MNPHLQAWGLVGLLIFCSSLVHAQLPRFAQYRAYRSIINPAALESHYLQYDRHYNLTFGLSYRNESAFSKGDSPHTQLANINWVPKMGNQFRLLVGGYVMQDQFGATKMSSGAIRLGVFSYNAPFGNISLGFNVGFNQFRRDLDESNFLDGGDNVLGNNLSQSNFNLGLGLFYSKRLEVHDWYIGFSVPQLFNLDLLTGIVEEEIPTKLSPQFYGLIGAHIYGNNQNFWEPSLWIKYLPDEDLYFEENTYHVDFNLRYNFYATQMWIGAGLSSQQSYLIEWGIDIGALKRGAKALRLGTGYTFSSSPLPNASDHSFEINLSLLLNQ